jgi:hypothetical protein
MICDPSDSEQAKQLHMTNKKTIISTYESKNRN